MNSPSQSLSSNSSLARAQLSHGMQTEPLRLEGLITENLKLREELELLAYAVSHDLYAPIRHINQYIALAIEENESETNKRDKEFLMHAGEACKELNKHIKAILQYSRLGRQELEWDTIQLQPFFEKIIEPYRSHWEGQNISID
ncbi:MAG: hypothetical protein AAF399_28330, partial [Bacteroidota bacterium]